MFQEAISSVTAVAWIVEPTSTLNPMSSLMATESPAIAMSAAQASGLTTANGGSSSSSISLSSIFDNDTLAQLEAGNFSAISELDELKLLNFPSKREDLITAIPLTVIFALLLVTGCVGNLCTAIVIARPKNKYMHTATNYYLFSLAMSDFLFLILGLPHEMYTLWQRYPYMFGEPFCIIRGFLSEASTYASILTISAFTVERYVAICHPLWAHTMSQLPRAITSIVIIWLLAAVCAIPPAAELGIITQRGPLTNRTLEQSAQCATKRTIYENMFVVSAIVFFIVPMIIVTVLYILIAIELRRSTKMNNAMAKQQSSSLNQLTSLTQSALNSTRNRLVARCCHDIQGSVGNGKRLWPHRSTTRGWCSSELRPSITLNQFECALSPKNSIASSIHDSAQDLEATNNIDVRPSSAIGTEKLTGHCSSASQLRCDKATNSAVGISPNKIASARRSLLWSPFSWSNLLSSTSNQQSRQQYPPTIALWSECQCQCQCQSARIQNHCRQQPPKRQQSDQSTLLSRAASNRAIAEAGRNGSGLSYHESLMQHHSNSRVGSSTLLSTSGKNSAQLMSQQECKRNHQADICVGSNSVALSQSDSHKQVKQQQQQQQQQHDQQGEELESNQRRVTSNESNRDEGLAQTDHDHRNHHNNNQNHCVQHYNLLHTPTCHLKSPHQYYHLMGSQSTLLSQQQQQLLQQQHQRQQHQQHQSRRLAAASSKKSVIRMLVAVVVSFFICWLPFHAQRLLASYLSKDENQNQFLLDTYLKLTYISGVMYYLSSTINPLLYQLMSAKFRLAFKETFKCSLFQCLNSSNQHKHSPSHQTLTHSNRNYSLILHNQSTITNYSPNNSIRENCCKQFSQSTGLSVESGRANNMETRVPNELDANQKCYGLVMASPSNGGPFKVLTRRLSRPILNFVGRPSRREPETAIIRCHCCCQHQDSAIRSNCQLSSHLGLGGDHRDTENGRYSADECRNNSEEGRGEGGGRRGKEEGNEEQLGELTKEMGTGNGNGNGKASVLSPLLVSGTKFSACLTRLSSRDDDDDDDDVDNDNIEGEGKNENELGGSLEAFGEIKNGPSGENVSKEDRLKRQAFQYEQLVRPFKEKSENVPSTSTSVSVSSGHPSTSGSRSPSASASTSSPEQIRQSIGLIRRSRDSNDSFNGLTTLNRSLEKEHKHCLSGQSNEIQSEIHTKTRIDDKDINNYQININDETNGARGDSLQYQTEDNILNISNGSQLVSLKNNLDKSCKGRVRKFSSSSGRYLQASSSISSSERCQFDDKRKLSHSSTTSAIDSTSYTTTNSHMTTNTTGNSNTQLNFAPGSLGKNESYLMNGYSDPKDSKGENCVPFLDDISHKLKDSDRFEELDELGTPLLSNQS